MSKLTTERQGCDKTLKSFTGNLPHLYDHLVPHTFSLPIHLCIPIQQLIAMANQRRSSSISIARRSQQLPPLPLSDLPPLNTNIVPYRDDPEDESRTEQLLIEHKHEPQPLSNSLSTSPPTLECKPPDYEPMYDYLRSHHRLDIVLPTSYLTTTTLSSSHPSITLPNEPYQDEPFIITVDPDASPYADAEDGPRSQPPPPSYDASEQERQQYRAMGGGMMLTAASVDVEGNHAEDVCKFLAAMVLIALTVGVVGTAFSWGG